MPEALTDRQKEYLAFIEKYIEENLDSPSLKDITDHFKVKPPSAHKMLDALRTKGFIHSARSSSFGYFIRLIENHRKAEKIIPLYVMGKSNQRGEINDFPDESTLNNINTKVGEMDTVFPDMVPMIVYGDAPHIGIRANHRIHNAGIEKGDILVVELGKVPEKGFITLLPIGYDSQWVLCWTIGKTYGEDIYTWEMREPYPVPEKMVDQELGQEIMWRPIAYEDDPEYFEKLYEEGVYPYVPIPKEFAIGTVTEIIREY